MKPAVLARLALAGSRTDTLRVVFTAASSAATTVALLAAATVAAVRELGDPREGSTVWNDYGNPLLREPGLRPGVVFTLVLVALPLLALTGQCVRFGSPSRDRRLASMRLAGATPRQAVLIATGETAMSALLGSVLGLGVFFVLRWALDRPDRQGVRPLPTDVLPSVPWVVLILLLVPVLGGLFATLLMRKVIITPLGVVRHTREHRPSVLPGVLIIAGVFAPFVIRPFGKGLTDRFGDGLSSSMIMIGILLLILLAILGVVLGTGWICYTVGRLLRHFGRRPAMLLAGRQLMADPWSGSRTFAALLGVVILGAGVRGYRAMLDTEFRARDLAAASDPEFSQDTDFYFNTIKLVDVAVLLGVVVAAAAILIALVEGIVARRRAYAALIAVGVPRRTLGEAIAWQALTPLVPATVVALTVGVGLIRAPITTVTSEQTVCSGSEAETCVSSGRIELPIPIPFGELVQLGAITMAVMALVAVAGWRLLRMTTDLEELRVG